MNWHEEVFAFPLDGLIRTRILTAHASWFRRLSNNCVHGIGCLHQSCPLRLGNAADAARLFSAPGIQKPGSIGEGRVRPHLAQYGPDVSLGRQTLAIRAS